MSNLSERERLALIGIGCGWLATLGSLVMSSLTALPWVVTLMIIATAGVVTIYHARRLRDDN